MNRSFPSNVRMARPRRKIADLLFKPRSSSDAPDVVPVHSGGPANADFLAFRCKHNAGGRDQQARCCARRRDGRSRAFSVEIARDRRLGMYDGLRQEAMGKTFVTTELGGVGHRPRRKTAQIARKGVA